MKLNSNYLHKAYQEAAIEQKMAELKAAGYKVSRKKEFDLFAQKGDERKAFEFKFLKGNQVQDSVHRFIKMAEELNAEPIVVYMSEPERAEIQFDDLGELMQEYLMSEFPPELDELSTHTRLEEVYIEHIGSINVEEKWITVRADASVCVSLQYGSDRECEGEPHDYMTFPMTFEAVLNREREIVQVEYEINTESFYG